jgi:hypothetical protein
MNTFFPHDVRFRLEQLETSVQHRDEDYEIAARAEPLVEELRRWEREWRAGRVRLVPQVEAKPNGEGGL